MAENEGGGAGGESGQDLGMKVDVVVGFGAGTKADLSDSINKTVDTKLESNLQKVLTESKTANNNWQQLSKLLSNMVLGNKSLGGKGNAVNKVLEQVSVFGEKVAAMGTKGISNTEFRAETNKANQAMVRAMTALQQIYPTAAMPKRGASDPASSSFKALAGQVQLAAERQARAVNRAATAAGLPALKMTPRGLEYNPNASSSAAPAPSFSSTQARQGYDLKKRFEQANLDKVKGLVGPTKGISLDTETATAAGDLWAVAYRTEKTGMVKLQQNLAKAGIKADEFHKNYVKNLTENSGESVSQIVSKFHDAWAASGGTGVLNGAGTLPPITGHNLKFDLDKMSLAANAAIKENRSPQDVKKAEALGGALNSILSATGINRDMLTKGDTQLGWAKFVREDLGFTAHKLPGKAGGFGNALPSIAAALGIQTTSHDVTADTRMTDLLQRSFQSKTGRESLKAMFNAEGAGFAPWMREAEKGSLASKFRGGIKQHFGEQNMHYAESMLKGGFAPGLEPIAQGEGGKDGIQFSSPEQLRDVVRAQNAEQAQKYRQEMLASRLTDFGPDSIPQVTSVSDATAITKYSKDRFLGSSNEITKLLHGGLTTKIAEAGGKFEGNEYEYAVDELLDERGKMSDYLNNTVEAMGIKDVDRQQAALREVKKNVKRAFLEHSSVKQSKAQALETIAGSKSDRDATSAAGIAIPDADSPADIRPGFSVIDTNLPNDVKLTGSKNELKTALDHDLGKVFDQMNEVRPEIAKRYKTLFKQDLRISDLSGLTAGTRDFDDLKKQAQQSRFHAVGDKPDPGIKVEQKGSEDAFRRGNQFEKVLFEKGSPILDKYETFKTGEDQLNARIGGFNAHPDAFLRNKATGEVSIGEAKYRGNQKMADIIKSGQLPPQWITQTNAYALATGQPNIPTTFLMGTTEAGNAETDELQRKIDTPGYSKAEVRKMEAARDSIKDRMSIEQERLGTVAEYTVQPDKAVQDAILQQIATITGLDATKPADIDKVRKDITGLPAEVVEGLIGGRGESLGQIIENQRAKTAASGKKPVLSMIKESKELQQAVADLGAMEDTFQVEEGNAGKGPAKVGGGRGGGGDEPPKPPRDFDDFEDRWNPDIALTKQDRQALAEKRFAAARKAAESASLDMEATKKYLTNKSGGSIYRDSAGEFHLKDTKFDLQGAGDQIEKLNNLQKTFDEKRALAQGYQAEVDSYALDNLTQKPLTVAQSIDKRASEITRDKALLKEQDIAAAKEAATNASAFIKADGLTTTTLSAATKAAARLRELGVEGTAGYTEQQLYRQANVKGVSFAEPKLDSVTGGMKSTADLLGVQGKTGLPKMTAEATAATDAVGKLFKQLSQHTGQDFMSGESKSVQKFIQQAQQAQEAALSLREKAKQAQTLADTARTSGTKTGKADAAIFDKSAATATAEANAKEAEALELAAKAKDEAAKLTKAADERYNRFSARDELVEANKKRETEVGKKIAQLEGKAMMPGYVKTRADRDSLDALKREQAALKSGQPIAPQKFNRASELFLNLTEAKAKLDAFKLNAQKQSIKLKVEVDTQGMTPESLQAIMTNNAELAKQGLKSPGMSTYDALAAMRAKDAEFRKNAVGLQPDTPGYQGYFDSLKAGPFSGQGEGFMDTGASAFDDLMKRNEQAKATVEQLHGEASKYSPDSSGLKSADKDLQNMQTSARGAIDQLAELDSHQKSMQAEANVTSNLDERAKKQAQADDLAKQRDLQALEVKRQIAQVETALHKRRVDPSSREAVAKHTVQIKAQLAAEKEALIVERQKLSLRMKQDGGVHVGAQELGRLTQLNSTLDNRFGVGPTKGSATTTEIEGLAKQKGIGLAELGTTGGKAGKSKDFVGGAIDLIDWQLQWLAGVSVLNAVSAAFKNSIGFAVQYEAAMKNVQLITQANTTEFDQLAGEVTRLATNFQYGALEVGEALVILGQAGFTATESLAILPNITALATATMANLKIATDITTTAIEAFNVPMAKVPALVNTIAAMTIESKLDIEKLGTSFNYIASTASAAGFSIEETGTAMGLMSNAGVRASTIGTSLRSTIGSLMNPTAKFRKALADVGLSADDVNPATHRLGEIFVKLKKAGFDVSSAFAGLDKRIAGGIITLVDSADQFDTFQASITGTNRAFLMAEGQMDTFSAQVKRMKNTFQLLGGDWFQADLEPLQHMASAMNAVLRVGLRMSEEVPDGLKTMVNSTLALTAGASVFGGVGRGVLDVNSNIQKALKDEKEQFFKPRKNKLGIEVPYQGQALRDRRRDYKKFRGSTLQGRNKQVYSTFKTLFDPRLMLAAATMAGAIMLVGKGLEFISGKMDLNAQIKLADKFETEADAMKSAADAYKEAAEGTTEFYLARKRLADLGVSDFSSQGILEAQALANARRDVSRDQVIKKRVTNRQHGWTKFRDNIMLSDTETEQSDKAFAAELEEYLKDRGLYWTASEGEMIKALREAGVARDGDGKEQRSTELALASIRSARQGDNAAAMARSTVSDKFDENKAFLENVPAMERALEATRASNAATTSIDFDARVGYTTDEDRDRDLEQQAKLAGEAFDAAMKEVEQSKKQRLADLKRLAKEYKARVMEVDVFGEQSGSQKDAEDAMLEAYNAILEINNETMLANNMQDGDIKDVTLHKLKSKQKDAKAALLRTGRASVMKSGFPGLQQNLVGLANDFLEFMITPNDSERGFDLTGDSVKAFRGMDVSVMTGLGKKLSANREAKNLEIANMSHLFKEDGVLVSEAKAVIDIKYKIKAENIVQGQMDAALKPLQDAYDRIEAIRDQRTGVLTAEFGDNFQVQDALLSNEISERAVQGASDVTRIGTQTLPYRDNRDFMRGYSQSQAARDRIEMETRRLENKQTADQGAYDTQAAANKTQLATKLEQLSKRGFATEQNRNTARIKLETEYTKKAVDLSKKRRDQLIADLNSIQSIRTKHADRITKLQKTRDDVSTSYTDLVERAKTNVQGETQETASRLQRRAFTQYTASKDLFRAGDDEGGTAAYKKAQSILAQIIDGDYSDAEITRAGRSAAEQRVGLEFTLADAVSAEKQALGATEDLLGNIKGILEALLTTAKEGRGTITYMADVTHPDGTVTKEERTISTNDSKPKLESKGTNVGTASYVDKDGKRHDLQIEPAKSTNTSGTESLVDNETKLKNLLSEGEVNEKTLADRLELATKSVEEVVSGMSNQFIAGLESGAPIIGRMIGDAAYESILEHSANLAQERADAAKATGDELSGESPAGGTGVLDVHLKIDDNKFGIAVEEVIKKDLTGLK